MNFETGMDIIEFDSFDTAFPVKPGDEGAVKRRFMTLFAQSGAAASAGGTSYVTKVQSFTGETFALKRLLPRAGIPDDAALDDEDTARITQGHVSAFHEEYKNQLLVSRLQGFPTVYGYGQTGGAPAILMEWVEGVSLRAAAKQIAAARNSATALQDSADASVGATVARIGLAVLRVLDTMARLDATLVHRDISPANIMIRTDSAPLEEQLAGQPLDVCLIDFGSAAADTRDDPSYTAVARVWRNGTPEYAAPEMLTQDIPNIDALRKSPKIDVFALCSVLYELYCGRTPWNVAGQSGISPYQLKVQTQPAALHAKVPEDAPLVAAIMSGLAVGQDERPSVHELAETLSRSLQESSYRFAMPDGAAGVRTDAGRPSANDGAGTGTAQACFADDSARTGSEQHVGFEAAKPESGKRGALAGLYTPDSTHLRMADGAEGGKRAGQSVPAFQPEQRSISRRALVIGGATLAAAIVAGAGAGTWLAQSRQGALEGNMINSAAVAQGIYDGLPFYPARDLDSNAWNLIAAKGSGIGTIALDAAGHTPGRYVDGLVRVYHAESRGWGFKTVEASDATGARTVWAFNRTYADAGDFSSMADPADPERPELRLAAVQDPASRRWGYIDGSGATFIGARFAQAHGFSNGFAAVQIAQESSPAAWTLVDSATQEQAAFRAVAIGLCSSELLVPVAWESQTSWNFIHPDGSQAFEGAWEKVQRFSCGLAAVFDSANELWGFIDASGDTAIEPRYTAVKPFGYASDGTTPLAPARDPQTKLWGLIDANGAWAVAPRYLRVGAQASGLWPAQGSIKPTSDYDALLEKGSDDRFGFGYTDEAKWVIKPDYGDTLV